MHPIAAVHAAANVVATARSRAAVATAAETRAAERVASPKQRRSKRHPLKRQKATQQLPKTAKERKGRNAAATIDAQEGIKERATVPANNKNGVEQKKVRPRFYYLIPTTPLQAACRLFWESGLQSFRRDGARVLNRGHSSPHRGSLLPRVPRFSLQQ